MQIKKVCAWKGDRKKKGQNESEFQAKKEIHS